MTKAQGRVIFAKVTEGEHKLTKAENCSIFENLYRVKDINWLKLEVIQYSCERKRYKLTNARDNTVFGLCKRRYKLTKARGSIIFAKFSEGKHKLTKDENSTVFENLYKAKDINWLKLRVILYLCERRRYKLTKAGDNTVFGLCERRSKLTKAWSCAIFV